MGLAVRPTHMKLQAFQLILILLLNADYIHSPRVDLQSVERGR